MLHTTYDVVITNPVIYAGLRQEQSDWEATRFLVYFTRMIHFLELVTSRETCQMHHSTVAGEFHTGYAFDENDVRDAKALCQRFGIVIPEEYQKYMT
jgi:hypothetical protein